MSRLASLLVAFGLLTAPLPALSQSSGEPVTIFAAASTTDAVNDIAQAYAAKTGGALRPVLASPSPLPRQHEQGAPPRSAERRVDKECVSTCRFRWSRNQ